MAKKKNKGFSIVELLAVIVILALVLVIAVPQIFSTIEKTKSAAFESTAKNVAANAENMYLANNTLGVEKTIDCEEAVELNSEDYESCTITFDEKGKAKVQLIGKGRYAGMYICAATPDNAVITDTCELLINELEVTKVNTLWTDREIDAKKIDVIAKYNDGTSRKLDIGGIREEDSDIVISSPNWPNSYTNSMTEANNYWEYTFDNAVEIQITFDSTSETESISYDWISIYDKTGTQVYKLGGTTFAGGTYSITGDYIKVAMRTDGSVVKKGFSSTLKIIYYDEPEYTISPSKTPSTGGPFNITVSLNLNAVENKGREVSSKINVNVNEKTNAVGYLTNLLTEEATLKNGLSEPKLENKTSSGIRYVGENVNNYVYYNCKDKDSNNIAYGKSEYNYASSCETWRIIGVFDVASESGGTTEKRVKLISDKSILTASWDSSSSSSNYGYGINEWSTADIKTMLNTYYIGTSTSCTYCNAYQTSSCANSCTSSVTPLSSSALNMIDNALWNTGAVNYDATVSVSDMYAGERGNQNGKMCTTGNYCNDSVKRTTEWQGKVGLIYPSDFGLASTETNCFNDIVGSETRCTKNNWLYTNSNYWSITPTIYSTYASYVWRINGSSSISYGNASNTAGIRPSVYLKNNVQLIDGDGSSTNPFVLSI